MKNIVVIQTFRFGDLLQSTPAIAALRQNLPDANIRLIARKGYTAAVADNPHINEVIEWDVDAMINPRQEPEEMSERMFALRDFVSAVCDESIDLVCNLSSDIPSALLAYMLQPKETIGLTFNADRRYRVQNEWMRYLFLSTDVRSLNSINLADVFLRACGGKGPMAPVLATNPADEAYAIQLLSALPGRRRPVALQIGASHEQKRWPLSRFTELASRLSAEGYELVFLGAENEQAQTARIVERIVAEKGDALTIAGRTNFNQLAAVLKRCRLLISNDTATVHAAAAAGVPSLTLAFATSAGWDTGPYAEGHYILEPRHACFPCKWHGQCVTTGCRDRLTVDAVHAAADLALDGLARPVNVPRLTGTILYRSCWMPDGLLGLEPVNRPPLQLKDILRASLRTCYVSRLLGVSTADFNDSMSGLLSHYSIEDSSGLALAAESVAADLIRLGHMAELGTEAAQAAIVPGRSVQARVHLAQALEQLDKRILACEENETLRFVVAAFRHGFVDMDATSPREKAACHKWNHHVLADSCSFLGKSLKRYAAQMRRDDFSRSSELIAVGV